MPNGTGWTVQCLNIASGCHFHSGWPEFSQDNRIAEGDTLTFMLVDVGTFHVQKFRAKTGCQAKGDVDEYDGEEGTEEEDYDTSDDYVPFEDKTDSNESDDYVEEAGVLDDDDYPMFTVVLTRKHLQTTLEIPYEFIKLYVCMGALKSHVYFNVNGQTWRVLLGHTNKKVWVQQGWHRFRDSN